MKFRSRFDSLTAVRVLLKAFGTIPSKTEMKTESGSFFIICKSPSLMLAFSGLYRVFAFRHLFERSLILGMTLAI